MKPFFTFLLLFSLAGASGLTSAAAKAAAPSENPSADNATLIKQSWQSLPDDLKVLLGDMESEWDKLPAEKQQALRERAEQFATLSEDEQSDLLARYQRWADLPEGERKALQRKYEAFQALPDEIDVNSYHTYAIAPEGLARELRIAAQDLAGNVEAFFHPIEPMAAIMWHPEREAAVRDFDRRLMENLFKH